MINNSLKIAEELLKVHEGLRLKPYACTAGKLTIGYGRNLEDNGISQDEANIMLKNDIVRTVKELTIAIEDFEELTEARQAVLIDMLFNLGLTRFLKFRKMLKAIDKRDFESASAEMLDSKWATQVGEGRSKKLAKILREGVV